MATYHIHDIDDQDYDTNMYIAKKIYTTVTILRNRGMALSFSKPLKEGIIKDWLRGKNRDTIAHENGLSTGTVSNIVRNGKKK